MHRAFIVLGVLLLTFAAGCSRVQVSQDFRTGMDFTRYTGYQLQEATAIPADDIRVNNPLLHERFRQAIQDVLNARGYSMREQPDFLVGYSYTIQTRLESDPHGTSFGFGYGRNYRYGEVGYGYGGAIRQYDVGVLVINVFDGLSGDVVWRGTGSEIVTTHSSPEQITAFVYRMVNAILQQFPPG